jgi:hypothetical protein
MGPVEKKLTDFDSPSGGILDGTNNALQRELLKPGGPRSPHSGKDQDRQ